MAKLSLVLTVFDEREFYAEAVCITGNNISKLKDDDNNSNSTNHNVLICVMMGLPLELTIEELHIFLEPFECHIKELIFVREVKEDKSRFNVLQMKKIAEIAHCIVFIPNEIEINDNNLISHHHINSDRKLTNHSVGKGLKWWDNHLNNQKVQSTRQSPLMMTGESPNNSDALYLIRSDSESHNITATGTAVINAYGSIGSMTRSVHFLNSIVNNNDVKDKNFKDVNDISQQEFLPTCTICLRRIKNFSNIMGIEAANDLIVARTCDVENGKIRMHTEQESIAVQIFTNYIQINNNNENTNYYDNYTRCFACFIYDTLNDTNSPNSSRTFDFQATESSSSSAALSKPVSQGLCRKIGYCIDCGILENVWLCLICSYTGCGRYTSKHAQNHFDYYGHHLSLELASGRIWDYKHDLYVHYEEDNRLVDFESNSLNNQSHHNSISDFTDTSNLKHKNSPFLYSNSANNRRRSNSHHHSTFDDPTMMKFDHLLVEYENLLRSQLQDQQLYYEKILARETVTQLELSYQPNNNSNNISTVTDEDLEEIEHIKLEISAIEQDYRELVQETQITMNEIRKAKKRNDSLLKKLKQQKEEEMELIRKEEAVRVKCADEVADLEQQIIDLNFYARTRHQVETSPYKDELANGTVITKSNSSTPNATTNNNNSNKKKSNKKK
eukprot:gene7213-9843_t